MEGYKCVHYLYIEGRNCVNIVYGGAQLLTLCMEGRSCLNIICVNIICVWRRTAMLTVLVMLWVRGSRQINCVSTDMLRRLSDG